MSNMSYCKFENTEQDLRDCKFSLWDKLSQSEKDARENLIQLCRDIVEMVDTNQDAEGYPIGENPGEEDRDDLDDR